MAVVRVFVRDDRDRVLLVQTRHKHMDGHYWIVPGGMIEEGEYSRDAAIREVQEETGLRITIKRLVWVEESKNDEGRIGSIYYFVAEAANGAPIVGYDPELPENGQKIIDVAYKSRDEIQRLEKVYPEIMKHDDFWAIMEADAHDPYVTRPSRGFGHD
ncbi:NUDIX hydrolase [Paenibacillus lycopersici]|uniref:NUDIX hydrolase n=1 Tax=Paenibacillus lycopersici TaxID=2704462 RepID=A0A6C0G6I5_9BACL|nr:NUDIX hydrolase [Paenibacillus lycopersici]QHT63180.1 NUDIX hydrolase [Paenibacillus lycopersici]